MTGRARVWLTVAACTMALVAGVASLPAADKPDEIPVTIEKNRFSPEEIKVKAGVPFVLVITNKDGAPEEFEKQGAAHREGDPRRARP